MFSSILYVFCGPAQSSAATCWLCCWTAFQVGQLASSFQLSECAIPGVKKSECFFTHTLGKATLMYSPCTASGCSCMELLLPPCDDVVQLTC